MSRLHIILVSRMHTFDLAAINLRVGIPNRASSLADSDRVAVPAAINTLLVELLDGVSLSYS
jgi:hypothetical protein